MNSIDPNKEFLDDLLSDTIMVYERAKYFNKVQLANWYQRIIDEIKAAQKNQQMFFHITPHAEIEKMFENKDKWILTLDNVEIPKKIL